MERVTGHRANQSLLKEWTANVVRGEPITVGDRNERRSFTYVTDIAAGICAVLDAPTLRYDTYNNSSAEWTTMAEVVAALRELRPDLRTIDVADKDLSGRASKMDVSRIERDVGFVAQFDLKDGLRDYLAWREGTGFTE